MEHLGVVVGNGVDEFSRVHRAALTGQQFQSPTTEPMSAPATPVSSLLDLISR